MQRLVTWTLSAVLATTGLSVATPAQAVGTGSPQITSPAANETHETGDTVSFDVDFSDAPADTYNLQVLAPDSTVADDRTYDNPADDGTLPFTLTVATAGNYTFTIKNSSSAEVASLSFTVTDPPPPPPPPVVSPPVATVQRPGAARSLRTSVSSKRVRLLWTEPASNGGAALSGYQVKRGAQVLTLGAGTTSFLFTKLVNKRRYAFSVRARNGLGFGPWATTYGTPHKLMKVKKKKKKKAQHAKPKHQVAKPHSSTAQTFANCDAMHQVYPHGVGRPGAVDNGGVTDFYVSAALYNANTKSDRDKDGVACEA